MYKFSNDLGYADSDLDYAVYEEKVIHTNSRLRTLRTSITSPRHEKEYDTLARLMEQQTILLQQ
ncbi:unnamed protein product [Ceratitis capitata]|uniref:(Mediterranean fruit fly) hypothetical protein n=1 Tax=Ceratitis capitata TaxID=7213 RepID=A0A811UWD0_CERCA|nr:unnamed protein product [Ceratitis capitata]